MAVTDAVQKLAYARFQEPYQQMNMWRSLARDYSSDFPYGDTLVLPTDTGAKTDGTTPNYKWNSIDSNARLDATPTEQAWGAPTVVDLETVELKIDKAWDLNKLIARLTERRVRPSFLNEAMMHSSRELEETINEYIRSVILANADVQKTDFDDVTAAVFAAPTDALRKTYVDTLADMQYEANVAYWPMDQRYCITSPYVYRMIVDQLEKDNRFYVQAPVNDRASVDGMVIRWRGWDIMSDNSVGSGIGANDDDKHAMFFLRRGIGVGYAQDLQQIRFIENSEVYRGLRILGQFSFGAAVLEPAKLFVKKTVITA